MRIDGVDAKSNPGRREVQLEPSIHTGERSTYQKKGSRVWREKGSRVKWKRQLSGGRGDKAMVIKGHLPRDRHPSHPLVIIPQLGPVNHPLSLHLMNLGMEFKINSFLLMKFPLRRYPSSSCWSSSTVPKFGLYSSRGVLRPSFTTLESIGYQFWLGFTSPCRLHC